MYSVKYKNIIIGIIESLVLVCIVSFALYKNLMYNFVLTKKIDSEIMS